MVFCLSMAKLLWRSMNEDEEVFVAGKSHKKPRKTFDH